MKKYILEGVIQKADPNNRGRIYPSNAITSTIGVAQVGAQLYQKYGASYDERISGYKLFSFSDDLHIRAQALQGIIVLIGDKIKERHL